MAVISADRVAKKLSQLPSRIKAKVDRAVAQSGEELIRTAKVLIPVGDDEHGDGRERDKIRGQQNADGSYLCDFGLKSKVIEGGPHPRPFVNQALTVTRRKYKARAKRAVNLAAKELFNG